MQSERARTASWRQALLLRGFLKVPQFGSSEPTRLPRRKPRATTARAPNPSQPPHAPSRHLCSLLLRNGWTRMPGPTGRPLSESGRAFALLMLATSSSGSRNRSQPRCGSPNRIHLPVGGFETLESWWQRWSAASEPQMSSAIFAPSVEAHRERLRGWLNSPPAKPLIVAADSRGEALALLACLLQSLQDSERAASLAVVFDTSEPLRTLASSSSKFIPIASSESAERELAAVYRKFHSVVIRPRNAVDSEPDIAADLLTDSAFEKAVASMGVPPDRVERLALESGRSPTILRRRLSRIDAVRIPHWAEAVDDSRAMVPMALVGAWHATSKADCDVVSLLAGKDYPSVEADLARLLRQDDCPVWSVGQYRGVASKLDALFAIAWSVTTHDLTEFLTLAEYVLSESDPALQLPEEKRWYAGLYGKVRDHSAALRRGVCETLVLLAVHGDHLFRERLGLNLPAIVAALVTRLLTPLTPEKLQSQVGELPRYAEAAPAVLLSILEEDLKQPTSSALQLLKPASDSFLGGCPRSGLLWALECLAWDPVNLPRVILILAKMSQTKIEDNWANKPMASLAAVFRSWLPQTAAPVEARIRALELLVVRYPAIGWQIAVEQFSPGSHLGSNSYRPRWRNDASGAGDRASEEERIGFARSALDIALGWPTHSEETLGDLVERLQGMDDAGATTVWDLIDSWISRVVDASARARLRERIRRFALTRRGQRRGLAPGQRSRALDAYRRLEPSDPVNKNGWLFNNAWLDESAEELEVETIDMEKREARVDQLRLAAMADLWASGGASAIESLAAASGAPNLVGWYAARTISGEALADLAGRLLNDPRRRELWVGELLRGFFGPLAHEAQLRLLSSVAATVPPAELLILLRSAPFGQDVWRFLDQYEAPMQAEYWRTIVPNWIRPSEAEAVELVDRLLDVSRPRTAFGAVRLSWDKLETSRLERLLFAVGRSDAEEHAAASIDAYTISEALKSLAGRTGVSSESLARLEFMYLDVLDHDEYGIPNLERLLASSPSFFAQIIALVFKRQDGGTDPAEWRIEDPERRGAVATSAYRLLNRASVVPGTTSQGDIDSQALASWVGKVRSLCLELGRADHCDQYVGTLMAKAPIGGDGSWPCQAVSEAMEAVASEEIANGFVIATLNARGAHWRGEGGTQERELAQRYRNWAERRAYSFPFVSSVLSRVAESYDHEAQRQDSETTVRKRLRTS